MGLAEAKKAPHFTALDALTGAAAGVATVSTATPQSGPRSNRRIEGVFASSNSGKHRCSRGSIGYNIDDDDGDDKR